ncbi:MAG: substrate-binding domain-containing protein [Candidatus Villigracilaceae bacterium]
MRLTAVCLLALTCLTACNPATPTVTPQVISVHYTFSTRPKLADLYDCAAGLPGTVLQTEERNGSFLDPLSADLILRLGAPPRLDTPAYALGADELVFIIHPSNPIVSLTSEQVTGLFSGRIRNWSQVGGADAPVEIWGYPEGEDIQQVLQADFLDNAPLTPLARLASGPEEMSASVASHPAAIGFLPGGLLSGSVRPVTLEGRTNPLLPTLAIVREEPQGKLRALLACLQEKAR